MKFEFNTSYHIPVLIRIGQKPWTLCTKMFVRHSKYEKCNELKVYCHQECSEQMLCRKQHKHFMTEIFVNSIVFKATEKVEVY